MKHKLTTFREILHLWKNWFLLIVIAAVIVYLGTSILNSVKSQKESYTATATVEVNARYDGKTNKEAILIKANEYNHIALTSSQLKQTAAIAGDKEMRDDISLSVYHTAETPILNVYATANDEASAVRYANALSDVLCNYQSSVETEVIHEGDLTATTHLETVSVTKIHDADTAVHNIHIPFPTKTRQLYSILTVFALLILSIAIELMRTKVRNIYEAEELTGLSAKVKIGEPFEGILFRLFHKPKKLSLKEEIERIQKIGDTTSAWEASTELLAETIKQKHTGKYPERIAILPVAENDISAIPTALLAKYICNDGEKVALRILSNTNDNSTENCEFFKIDDDPIEYKNTDADVVITLLRPIASDAKVLNILAKSDFIILQIGWNTCEANVLKELSKQLDNENTKPDMLILNATNV